MSKQVMGKLKPERCALLVCDVQDRFTSLITGFETVVDTCRKMVFNFAKLCYICRGTRKVALATKD